MDKKRRYEIPTNVRIPDMDEIKLAASNFAEPVETDDKKAEPNSKGYAPQRVRRVPKYEAQLTSIKNEMEQLANKVAIEEEEKEAAEATAEAALESEAAHEAEEASVPDIVAEEKREASDPLLESVAAVVKTTMEKKKTEAPKKTKNKSKE